MQKSLYFVKTLIIFKTIMLNLLNPNKTRAILIGTTEFVDFNNIDAVENNLTEFAKVLADEKIFGLLPENNIVIIKNQTNEDVELKLIEYTENARKENIETLIVYFAGHGFRNREGKYFLATKNSRKKLIRTSGNSAIAYDTVKRIIKSSKIPQTIIFIDACYSGSVAQGNDKQIFKKYIAEGTYTITSSDSTELSYFDSDAKHTIFTGELLNILKNGLQSIEKEKVSLTDLYKELRTSIKEKKPAMSPQQLASKEIIGEDFLFFKNTNYDKKALIQNQINEQMAEADNLSNRLELDKAELIYIRLKDKITTENIDFERNIIQELNEKINKCRNFAEQKKVFEQHYHTKPKKIRNNTIGKEIANKRNITIIASVIIIIVVLAIWQPWYKNNTEPITEKDTTEQEIIKPEYPKIENGVTWIDEKHGPFIDRRDTHKYKVIRIGEQVWMAENLVYETTNGCWAYDNDQSNVDIFGYLYDWETAKKVCPKGWSLPSDTEWTTLTDYLGGEEVAGEKMKSKQGWLENLNGINSSGFNALPGGYSSRDVSFHGVSNNGFWWSASSNGTYIWTRHLDNSGIYRNASGKTTGFSVRCIRK